MPKYNIMGVVAADKSLGEIEADTAEDAITKAWEELDCSSPSVCHQCSDELNVGDIYKLVAQNTEDDDDVVEEEEPSETTLKARIAELEAALEPFAVYAEKRAAKPFGGLDDSIHRIHVDTEYEAEITLAHCNQAVFLLRIPT